MESNRNQVLWIRPRLAVLVLLRFGLPGLSRVSLRADSTVRRSEKERKAILSFSLLRTVESARRLIKSLHADFLLGVISHYGRDLEESERCICRFITLNRNQLNRNRVLYCIKYKIERKGAELSLYNLF